MKRASHCTTRFWAAAVRVSASCQQHVQTCTEASGACAEPVELWSAEEPAVYGLLLELVDSEGPREGCEACQVAFRHTAVTGGELRHNGKPIMVRGVNRHEHDPITGKVRSCSAARLVHKPT
jgi:beta-galactosidase/beta-glucuronidase